MRCELALLSAQLTHEFLGVVQLLVAEVSGLELTYEESAQEVHVPLNLTKLGACEGLEEQVEGLSVKAVSDLGSDLVFVVLVCRVGFDQQHLGKVVELAHEEFGA